MKKYPCANTTCTNLTREPNELCDECRERENAATSWISRIINGDKQQRRERYDRHHNHGRKNGEE